MNEVKISKEIIEFIEKTPEFSNMLYDLDMLPEQLVTDSSRWGLRACYYIYKEMSEKNKKLLKIMKTYESMIHELSYELGELDG